MQTTNFKLVSNANCNTQVVFFFCILKVTCSIEDKQSIVITNYLNRTWMNDLFVLLIQMTTLTTVENEESIAAVVYLLNLVIKR